MTDNPTTPVSPDAQEEVVATQDEKVVSRRALVYSWLLWTFFSHSNYNYERLQATGFAHAMVPVIKKLYGDDPDQVRAALKRHLVFFNTAPDVGGVIHGITIAMEEQKANGKPVSETGINSMKTGLMGPMAGVGDTISQGILVPLFLALGIGITGISAASQSNDLAGITGNPLGPVVYFVLIVAASVTIGYLTYTQGYYRGRDLVSNVFKSGLMDRVIVGAGVLGNLVLGALAANFVMLFLAPSINAGGEVLQLQQDLLDRIMPGILPLGLVLLTWFFLKRGIHPIRLLIIYLVVCLIGAFPFFGPAPQFVTDQCGSALFQPYGPCPEVGGADGGEADEAFGPSSIESVLRES